MSIIWLRVALALYALGLVYVLVALTRTLTRASTRVEDLLSRVALHAAYLGMVFHFVAIAEAVQQSGELSLASPSVAASVLGFLIMVVFLIVYMSSTARQGWLIAHISLILTGYAALILSFSASLLYLFQERALKSKKPSGLLSRLPALQVTDEIGFRSLLIGFPFMTLGLAAGMVIAQASFGRVDFRDAKILLSLLMWAVYLILLYTRWSAGWRGRRAAFLAASTFAMAIVAWAANYFSTIHKLARP